MTFKEKIALASGKARSLVCVGLDTDTSKLPAGFGGSDGVVAFNREIIRATSDFVCAYKPNSAFYEALGSEGVKALETTCRTIPPDIPIILDVKRGDIGNTAEKYAEAAYDRFGADAVTVNPYMGFDAVAPFLRPGKCVFVLCLTSNSSSRDFQFLENGGMPLYERVARAAVGWAERGEIGLVAGATQPDALARIREIAGDMPILIPGIGAQGGDLDRVLCEAGAVPGRTIINSSRDILFASRGADFAQAARTKLLGLRSAMEPYL
jgi:orotidine-5'-phosphate decarboxylase